MMNIILALLLAAVMVWFIDKAVFRIKLATPIFRVLAALTGWKHRLEYYPAVVKYGKRNIVTAGWCVLIGPRYREVAEIAYDPVDHKITLRGSILTRDGVSSYSLSSKTECAELIKKLRNTNPEEFK